jgi:uncharacterized protein YutE (UPF0331/DUF86 family)
VVDRAIVQRKLAALAEYRGQLQEYATITVEAYRADWKIQRIVERTLQMMIELCADISGHVISDNGWSTPETYAETFRVLGEHGVLTPEQAVVMVKMAKFRNIVVHQGKPKRGRETQEGSALDMRQILKKQSRKRKI